MGKNRIGLHFVAVLAFVVFGFLAISSTATTRKSVVTVGEETIVSSTTTSRGRNNNMDPPHEKSYDTLGLVFATSVTEFDENKNEISSQEGIITMLLREAHKLGADDILNVRIDENTVIIQITSEGTTPKTYLKRTVTYTGSALAIKYNDKPVPASGGSFGNNFIPGTATIDGRFR